MKSKQQSYQYQIIVEQPTPKHMSVLCVYAKNIPMIKSHNFKPNAEVNSKSKGK